MPRSLHCSERSRSLGLPITAFKGCFLREGKAIARELPQLLTPYRLSQTSSSSTSYSMGDRNVVQLDKVVVRTACLAGTGLCIQPLSPHKPHVEGHACNQRPEDQKFKVWAWGRDLVSRMLADWVRTCMLAWGSEFRALIRGWHVAQVYNPGAKEQRKVRTCFTASQSHIVFIYCERKMAKTGADTRNVFW